MARFIHLRVITHLVSCSWPRPGSQERSAYMFRHILPHSITLQWNLIGVAAYIQVRPSNYDCCLCCLSLPKTPCSQSSSPSQSPTPPATKMQTAKHQVPRFKDVCTSDVVSRHPVRPSVRPSPSSCMPGLDRLRPSLPRVLLDLIVSPWTVVFRSNPPGAVRFPFSFFRSGRPRPGAAHRPTVAAVRPL